MKNRRMQRIEDQIAKIAPTDLNVLIVGQHGTGRDTVANSIHEQSNRKDKSMIKVDSIDITEKELNLKTGQTYYIDEIHRLSRRTQTKLLREMKRVPTARIIASATKALGTRMDEGKFSDDLYFMIAQKRIGLPDISEHPEELKDMVKGTVKQLAKKYDKTVRVSGQAMELLTKYNYEANITELKNLLERAVIVNKSGVIKSNSIMSQLDMENVVYATLVKNSGLDLNEELERYERRLIVMALKDKGTIRKAAQQLGISTTTLWNRCQKVGIVIKDKETMQVITPDNDKIDDIESI